MFDKYKTKFIGEKTEICRNLDNCTKKVSNLESCINNALAISSKLASLWDSSEYAYKLQLQNLVFPEGMSYCRKNNECRTPRVNSIFRYIAGLAGVSANEKSGDITVMCDAPALVEKGGEMSNFFVEDLEKFDPFYK